MTDEHLAMVNALTANYSISCKARESIKQILKYEKHLHKCLNDIANLTGAVPISPVEEGDHIVEAVKTMNRAFQQEMERNDSLRAQLLYFQEKERENIFDNEGFDSERS
jgi:hypothetical protein